MNAARLFVVMGVSGCGKSSIGEALADRFDGTFIEGDNLHPNANIERMSAGIPLQDDERWPWLENEALELRQSEGLAFASCSALRRSYRSFITKQACEPVFFIHLDGTRELIAGRMRERADHFMPMDLLDSQFATLEAPRSPELFANVDISGTENEILHVIVSKLTTDHEASAP